VCIRLPYFIKADPFPICELLEELEFSSGVLVYSPPGVGKTTLLRQVAASFSKGSGGIRVAVVDSRGELEFGLESRYLCVDVMSGYPKAIGIEIALRVMNPRLIVCDEIGNDDEVSAICSAAGGGAALLASAHAADICGLMAKKNIRELHSSGAFGAYVGLSRVKGGYGYDISYSKDICIE
jgi:stage III sporulation protein AA